MPEQQAGQQGVLAERSSTQIEDLGLPSAITVGGQAAEAKAPNSTGTCRFRRATQISKIAPEFSHFAHHPELSYAVRRIARRIADWIASRSRPAGRCHPGPDCTPGIPRWYEKARVGCDEAWIPLTTSAVMIIGDVDVRGLVL